MKNGKISAIFASAMLVLTGCSPSDNAPKDKFTPYKPTEFSLDKIPGCYAHLAGEKFEAKNLDPLQIFRVTHIDGVSCGEFFILSANKEIVGGECVVIPSAPVETNWLRLTRRWGEHGNDAAIEVSVRGKTPYTDAGLITALISGDAENALQKFGVFTGTKADIFSSLGNAKDRGLIGDVAINWVQEKLNYLKTNDCNRPTDRTRQEVATFIAKLGAH